MSTLNEVVVGATVTRAIRVQIVPMFHSEFSPRLAIIMLHGPRIPEGKYLMFFSALADATDDQQTPGYTSCSPG